MDWVPLADWLSDCDCEAEPDGVRDEDLERERVLDCDSVWVGERDGVGVIEGDPLDDCVADVDCDADTLGVSTWEGVIVGVSKVVTV